MVRYSPAMFRVFLTKKKSVESEAQDSRVAGAVQGVQFVQTRDAALTKVITASTGECSFAV